jgi:hypothetical protein
MTDLVFEQKIDLPYQYTAGPVQRAALHGLADQRLIASHADTPDGYVAVPATPFAPDGTHLKNTRELPAQGTLIAASTAHHHPGQPTFALIQITGASHPLLHHLAPDHQHLKPGSQVHAIWAKHRTGSINDITHFAPGPLPEGG